MKFFLSVFLLIFSCICFANGMGPIADKYCKLNVADACKQKKCFENPKECPKPSDDNPAVKEMAKNMDAAKAKCGEDYKCMSEFLEQIAKKQMVVADAENEKEKIQCKSGDMSACFRADIYEEVKKLMPK